MSHLECPNCRLKISALGAPLNCPRCLIRSERRIELVPAPMFLACPDRQARSTQSVQIQPFGLSVGELRPGCLKIEVQGELDLAVTDQLTDALAGTDEYCEVLLDLAQCDFVDSTGVAAILRAERLVALEGRRIVVVGARGQVLRVLTVMGLTDHGLVFASVEEALGVSPAAVVA